MEVICPQDDSLGVIPTSCNGSIDFTVAFENYILILIPSAILILLAPVRLQTIRARSIKVVSPTVLQAIKTFSALCYVGFSLATLVVSTRLDTIWRQSEIAADALSFSAALLCLALSSIEHFRSIRPSLLTQLYLMIATVSQATRCRSIYLRGGNAGLSAVCFGQLASCVAFLVAESTAKESILITRNKRSPQDVNNLFSQRLFLWLNGLFATGFKGMLKPKDLYSIDEELASPEIQRKFRLTLLAQSKRHPDRHLIFILLRTMGWYFFKPVIPRLLYLAVNFAQPYLIQRLIAFVGAPRDAAANEGPLLVVAGFLIYFFTAVTYSWYWQTQNRFETKLRAVLTTAVHEKALKAKADPQFSPLTLMNVDVEKAIAGLRNQHEFWAVMTTMGISLYLLKSQVGLSFLAPTILMAVMIGLVMGSGADVAPQQKVWLASTQKRIGFITHIVASMKSVKLMGLVPLALEMGTRLRQTEVDAQKAVRKAIFFNLMLSQFNFQLATLVMYGAYSIQVRLGGPPLTYSNLFTSMAFLKIFTTPLVGTIQYIPALLQAWAGMSRVQKYLVSAEHEDRRTESGSPDITLHGLAVGYDGSEENALNELDVVFKQGTFNVIIGPVGSGKSTLLKTLVGETRIASGSVAMSSFDTAFCDQSAWLWSASIKDNIVGETELNEAWLGQVVWACGLEEDIAGMPKGLDTPAGDDGAALSGGQKNRISLARALYARKPILVSDDVLAGLDTRTEALVFGRVFGPKGLVRKMKSTTILATHSVGWLKYADNVIALDAGRCVYQGNPIAMPQHLAETAAASAIDEEDEYVPVVSTALPIEVLQEDAKHAARDKRIYLDYLRSFGAKSCIIYFVVCALPTICSNMLTIVLQWLADADTVDVDKLTMFCVVMLAIVVANVIFLTYEIWYVFMIMMPKSSIYMHAMQLKAFLQVSFDHWGLVDNGDVANRFSQDISLVDMTLPMAFVNVSNLIYMILASMIIILIAAPYTLAILPLLGGLLWLIQSVYLRTSKQLKIMDLDAKAPLCTHFMQTVSGITTVRAYGWAEQNRQKNLKLLETSQAPFYLMLSIEQWLALVLGLVVAGFVTVLLAVVVAISERFNAGLLGLSLINLMGLGDYLSMLVQAWTLFDTSLGAVARIKTFCASMPQEEQGRINPDKDWLARGTIKIDHLEASYSPTADPILKDVSFTIPAGHKVAICGRSGSGKSSLASALFGLLSVRGGTISIDGVDITEVAQDELRARMIALPQDPFFLPGTVRANLAPRFFERDNVSDAAMLDALAKVGLRDKFTALAAQSADWATALDVELSPSDMLTRGQQQLFAMARTIVSRGQVVVIDEATSGLDGASDELVQKLIRSELKGKTIVAIAHRLNTIIDFDTVVVMSAGKVVEMGNPRELARKQGGWFWGLVQGGGGERRRSSEGEEKDITTVRIDEV